MKGLSTRISKTLIPGSRLVCADNSGAFEFMIIHNVGKGGRKGRLAAAGVGDIVIASVKKGTPQYLKKPVRVVIIRQKAPIRRANGMRVRFEDNAGVMIQEGGLPVGTDIKGPIAREVIELNINLAGLASKVV